MTVAVWTLGELLFMPTLTTMISLRADLASRPGGEPGPYQSLLSLAFGLGFGAGPALGARVYERFGGSALWLGTAALSAAVAAVFLVTGKRSAMGPEAEA